MKGIALKSTNLVFWHQPEESAPRVIDSVLIDDNGVQRGRYSGETLEQISTRYPNALIGDIDAVIADQEQACRTQPTACTEEDFFDALDMLPPEDWVTVNGVESFKMMERLSGRMTGIFARLGKTYWQFTDRCDLSAESIAEKIKRSAAMLDAA